MKCFHHPLYACEYKAAGAQCKVTAAHSELRWVHVNITQHRSASGRQAGWQAEPSWDGCPAAPPPCCAIRRRVCPAGPAGQSGKYSTSKATTHTHTRGDQSTMLCNKRALGRATARRDRSFLLAASRPVFCRNRASKKLDGGSHVGGKGCVLSSALLV